MAFSFPANGIEAGSFTSAVASLALTFPGGFSTAAGDVIVIVGSYDNGAGTANTSFSDGHSDTFTDSGLGLVNDTTVAAVGFVKAIFNPTVGTTTVTISWSGTHPGFGDMFMWCIRGGTSVQFDKVVQNSAGSGNGSSGSTGTLSSATEAAIAYGFTNGAFSGTVGGGFTSDGLTAGTDDIGMHQVVSATTALDATATVTGGAWHMFCATVMSGAGAAIPTWGWQSRREDERVLPISRLPDQAALFFRPSQIPVPTALLPTTGADRERLPPIQRTDWAPPTFQPSQIPVPQRWQPTAGEQDHPPVIKRPPDEPTGYFFLATPTRTTPLTWLPIAGIDRERLPPVQRTDWPSTTFQPSQVPVPQQWLPTTGQEDRPPNPNRIPAPDQPFPWFVRSPNVVLATLLPTTGAEDRPPAQKRPPDEPGTFFFTFKPPAGIAGMAWWRQTEVYLEPPPAYRDYRISWDPQFIVQVVPSFVEEYSNDFMSSVGRLGTIERNP